MRNFLFETMNDIAKSGHLPGDVMFIGSEKSGYQCTWKQFKKLANFDYDSGYGASNIPTDLIIVFEDGAKMWRGEYDGSEWWEFSTPFKFPKVNKQIETLKGGGWSTLQDIHEFKED